MFFSTATKRHKKHLDIYRDSELIRDKSDFNQLLNMFRKFKEITFQ